MGEIASNCKKKRKHFLVIKVIFFFLVGGGKRQPLKQVIFCGSLSHLLKKLECH